MIGVRNWRVYLVSAIGMVLIATVGTASAAFSVTTIDYPGAVSTTAIRVNEAGQVVGFYIDTSGVRHGFLMSSGIFSTIDCPSPYTAQSEANGINNVGQIVGICSQPGGVNGVYGASRSYIVSGGVLTLLPDIGTSYLGASTFAQAINDDGDIVGWYANTTLSSGHGFRLSGGVYTPIDVPGFANTFAYGINSSGQIVGAVQQAFGGGADHGFLLSGGTFTTLDDPNADPTAGTIAQSINDAGQIAGAYTDAAHVQHGFMLMNGVYTTADVLGALSSTTPEGNSLSQIVGGYRDAGGADHGFILQLCQDALSLTYSGGTLTIGFTLKTLSPGTWSTWLGVAGQVVPLWSGVPLPVIAAPAPINLPIPGFPRLGPVYVITALSNSGGSLCVSAKAINTGQ